MCVFFSTTLGFDKKTPIHHGKLKDISLKTVIYSFIFLKNTYLKVFLSKTQVFFSYQKHFKSLSNVVFSTTLGFDKKLLLKDISLKTVIYSFIKHLGLIKK